MDSSNRVVDFIADGIQLSDEQIVRSMIGKLIFDVIISEQDTVAKKRRSYTLK